MRGIGKHLLKTAKIAVKQQSRVISTLEGLSATELAAILLNSTHAGDLATVKKIVEKGKVDINKGGFDGRTPLHVACATGNKEMVEYLISQKADINAVDSFGSTPIQEAMKKEHSYIVKYLQEKGATLPNPIMGEVTDILIQKGVFNTSVINYEVTKFFTHLKMPEQYFKQFSVDEIATHIHSYIAAKKVAHSTSANRDDIWLVHETENEAYYVCTNGRDSIATMEEKIVKYLEATPKGKGYTLDVFTSAGTIGQKNLVIYSAKRGVTRERSERFKAVVEKAKSQMTPVIEKFSANEDGTIPVKIGIQNSAANCYLGRITEIVDSIPGMSCGRKYVETTDDGLVVYSLNLKCNKASDVDEFLNKATLLTILPTPSEYDDLLLSRRFTTRQVTYAHAATLFTFYFSAQQSEEFNALAQFLKDDPTNLARLQNMQNRMRNDALTYNRISQCVHNNTDLVHEIFVDFAKIASGEKPPELNKELMDKVTKTVADQLDQSILKGFLTFNSSILKTNFYQKDKAAIAFRLDPAKFLEGHSNYPVIPFGIFLVFGNDFQGFHVRFSDVARGGIRVIKSNSKATWLRNAENLFQENYNLSYTQEKKNKDIPEGGSKGTVLLSPQHQDNVKIAFKKYTDALLDLLLLNREGVVSHYKGEEILFLGPDENSADLMGWAALHAKSRGYPFWQSLTTGKSPELGGIPHDTYGMTTRSVHETALGILRKAGVKEEEVTKVMTGGPDGDLGSNEIKISKDKIKAVIDGSGVCYDPEGLDREELLRLANKRQMIENFDKSKLSPKGFMVNVKDRNVKLPHGELVENGEQFRNTFHLHDLFEADLFVPCGGRPSAININNVHRLFKKDGTPKIKYISEGANLFITQDARLVLEKGGVILYKDATANKGGVSCSSREVLASLALSDEDFAQHMCVKDGKVPPFYKEYVDEIIDWIRENARMEFECIHNEHVRTGTPRCIITDNLSLKINSINASISESKLWEDKEFVNTVLKKALPQTLIKKFGFESVTKRIPENYLKAIFSSYLAKEYIYTYGLQANEFSFYEFMEQFKKH
jgi:glutamate dehydrogenase